MTSPSTTRATLSDEDLTELLGLLEGADTVELKLTVPADDHAALARALDVDALDAQVRQVFFFDTPDLALNKAGVVVRARRVQGKAEDTVVKLRPVVPSTLPDELRASPSFGVEVDAMPGGFVCSGSLKRTLKQSVVRATLVEGKPLHKLFSKEQRAFYAAHSPEGIALDDLSVLGPVFVLKLKFSPKDYKGRLVAEMWLYPDGSRIIELSTKCAPADGFRVAAETRAFLVARGIDLSGEQQTKTKKALQFFSKRLASGDAA